MKESKYFKGRKQEAKEFFGKILENEIPEDMLLNLIIVWMEDSYKLGVSDTIEEMI